MSSPVVCTRCQVRAVWSSQMCWHCHRAYASEMRADPRVSGGLVRGIVVGIALVAGAIGAGAPGFVALAIVPVAIVFGSHASRRHRRAWIARTGATLPEARLLVSPRGPDSDKDR